MELLIKLGLSEDMYMELNDLIDWNKNNHLHPLNDFNHEWMNDNAIIESEELYSLATQIYKELSERHAYLICRILAEYGVIYANLALAEYYENNNNVKEAIEYYKKCLIAYDTQEIAKNKLRILLDK